MRVISFYEICFLKSQKINYPSVTYPVANNEANNIVSICLVFSEAMK
ncbi:protein of unknown function [Paraburkholderia dioscoreae]|uniref:Uncharacterized protein n=1 Tax=Paraburkholderia dioscoreae TaxID=2604047 RepID=A0A5Q4YSQ6_9BURK|nr:protein of unknown function [Paraburkholderia dioscoreae]